MEPELAGFTDSLVGLPVVSVGIDVVEISRIGRIVADRPRFVERVYCPAEADYARAGADPAERFAARFAAKEAGLKALGLGLGGADFIDLEIVKRPSGKPEFVLSGRAQDKATELGIGSWLVSLSHSEEVAIAIVVGLSRGL